MRRVTSALERSCVHCRVIGSSKAGETIAECCDNRFFLQVQGIKGAGKHRASARSSPADGMFAYNPQVMRWSLKASRGFSPTPDYLRRAEAVSFAHIELASSMMTQRANQGLLGDPTSAESAARLTAVHDPSRGGRVQQQQQPNSTQTTEYGLVQLRKEGSWDDGAVPTSRREPQQTKGSPGRPPAAARDRQQRDDDCTRRPTATQPLLLPLTSFRAAGGRSGQRIRPTTTTRNYYSAPTHQQQAPSMMMLLVII